MVLGSGHAPERGNLVNGAIELFCGNDRLEFVAAALAAATA